MMRTNRERVGAIWRFAKRYGHFFLIAEFCMLGTYAVSMVLPLNLAFLTDEVLVGKQYGRLGAVLSAYAILFLASVLLNCLYAYVWQTLNNRYIVDVKNTLYKKLLFAQGSELIHMDVGDCMSRIDQDSEAFIHAIQKNVFHFINSFFLCAGILVMVARLHPLIALSLLAAAGLPILLTRLMWRFTRRYTERMRDSEGKATGRIFEILEGIRDIRLLRAEKWADRYVRKWADTQVDCDNGVRRVDFLTEKAIHFLNLLTSIAVYAIMIWLLGRSILSLGVCLALIQYIALLHKKLNWMLRLTLDWQGRKVSIDRVLDILDMPEETKGSRPAGPISAICFENVSFSYSGRGEAKALKGLNLKFPTDSRVGIVGLSGAGKTTITGLLTGLYTPESGRILIDGVDLAELDLQDYREKIGVVQQEVALFRDTLRFNLLLGREAADEDLAEVLRQMGLEEVVCSLPLGLDTLMGETCGLSAGQKQRIMIARALLRHPRLLIFDESTASLDMETEALLHSNRVFAKQGCISVIISHRLCTVADCDSIVFLEEGAVRAVGSHKELWMNFAAYRAMFGEEAEHALSA